MTYWSGKLIFSVIAERENMLSKENEAKLVMSGLYRCEPNKKYRSSLHWEDMYHCFNWTFRVKKNESKDDILEWLQSEVN